MTCRAFRTSTLFHHKLKYARPFTKTTDIDSSFLRLNDKNRTNNVLCSRNISVFILSKYKPGFLSFLKTKMFGPFLEKEISKRDPEYSRDELLEGFKEAIITTSNLISEKRYNELRGLISDSLLSKLQERLEMLSSAEIQVLFKIDEKTVVNTSIIDLDIASDSKSDFQVTMAIVLLALPHIRNEEGEKLQHRDTHIYKFHRYVKGGTNDDWIITDMNLIRSGSFEQWAKEAAVLLGSSSVEIEDVQNIAKSALQYKAQLTANPENHCLWFPILRGLMKWMSLETMQAARTVLKKNWKDTWNWKDKCHDATEIFQILTSEKYDCVSDDNLRDIVRMSCCILKNLMEQLTIVKVIHLFEEDLAELAMATLGKARISDISSISSVAFSKVSFKNDSRIGQYLDQFYELMELDTFTQNIQICNEAVKALQCLVTAIEDRDDIPKQLVAKFNRVFIFCLSEEHDFIDRTSGSYSFYGMVTVEILSKYVLMFQKSGLIKHLHDLIPVMQKLRQCDVDVIRTIADVLLTTGGHCALQAAVTQDDNADDSMNIIIEMYITNPSPEVLSSLVSSYGFCKHHIAVRFDEMVEIFKGRKEEFTLQAMLLKNIAEDNPELFTSSTINWIMEIHFTERVNQCMILLLFEILSNSYPQVLETAVESMMKCETIYPEAFRRYINVLVKIASKLQKLKVPVYDKLIKHLKSTNNNDCVAAILQGLRVILPQLGSSMVKQEEREIFLSLKSTSLRNINDLVECILNEVDGRSLEAVSKEVVKHTNEIEILTEYVEMHEGEITDIQDDLRNVNQQIEGIYIKTVPSWSKKTSEMMNKNTGNNWKTLAFRLGYNQEEIHSFSGQPDPCMVLLSDWFGNHETCESTDDIVKILLDMDRLDVVSVIEEANKNELQSADERFLYDIYICNSSANLQEAMDIMKQLEQRFNLRCCFSERDFQVGKEIVENITDTMGKSNKILIILSQEFVKDGWCWFEQQEAFRKYALERRNCIIPLLLDNVEEIPIAIRNLSYINFEKEKDPIEKIAKAFWMAIHCNF